MKTIYGQDHAQSESIKASLRAADDAPRPKRGGWAIKTGRRRRPVAYSEALADLICDAIAQGGALYRLCEERADFPSEPTVYRWLDTRPGFAAEIPPCP